jgi:hypothetical protein
MNSPASGLRVASVITGLVSIAHLARLFLHFQILIGSHPVPVWMSGGVFVVSGLLSFWLWKLSLPAKPAAPATPAAP